MSMQPYQRPRIKSSTHHSGRRPEQLTLTTSTLDKASVRCQQEKRTQAFEARHKQLLSALPSLEVQVVEKLATYLRRRWLSSISFHPLLKLSDFELSAYMHHRTISPSHQTHYQHCGIRNEMMHDEVCPARPKWHIASHEQLKHALACSPSLSLGKGRIEPFVLGSHLRTDLSLAGSQAGGTRPQDFDTTITMLAFYQFRTIDMAKNTI
jgi:hypothetical protein